MARAADKTAIYAIRVRTISSVQDGSGIKGIYLPKTLILVIMMSATRRILHITSIILYVTSYKGLILSTVLKKDSIFPLYIHYFISTNFW